MNTFYPNNRTLAGTNIEIVPNQVADCSKCGTRTNKRIPGYWLCDECLRPLMIYIVERKLDRVKEWWE